MTPAGKRMSRRRIVMLAVLATGIGLAGASTWSWLNRWPVRLAIEAPSKSWPQGFTPDSRTFLTLSPEGVAFWDVATGKARHPWPKALMLNSFARDGQTCLGVVGYESGSATVGWVDVASGEIKARFEAKRPSVANLAFVDDERKARAVVSEPRRGIWEVVTWDLASGAETRKPITAASRLLLPSPSGYSPDGRTLALFDPIGNGVQLWDVDADEPIGPLLRTVSPPPSSWASTVFSRDGKRLVVGRKDGTVEVWSLPDRRWLQTIRVHAAGFTSTDMAISPNGRTLASTGFFSGATTWFEQARNFLDSRLNKGNPESHKDGLVVVDLETGQTLARSPGSFRPRFAPDGRTVVTQESWVGNFSVRDVPQPSWR